MKHIILWVFFSISKSCEGFNLAMSSDNATVGQDFTFTCVTTKTRITFKRDGTILCVITGGNADDTCVFNGGYIPDYTYTCNPTTNTYTVTIPGSYLTESLHGTTWICGNVFGGGASNNKTLYVNVPVSSVTLLSTSTDRNPVEVVSNRKHTFSCTTNAARPSSRIQWYLSTTNITTSASPQPDECSTECSDDKVISSSVLTYTGNITDDGKILYCTAVSIEGLSVVRSSNKTIIIWYGPNQVIITPSTQSYTLKETENLNQIQCTADCKPNCTMTWSGSNLLAGTTSVLNIQNINRNQTGNYQCTASNDVNNKTSIVVNVVVQYGPNQVIITPSTQSYTLKERDNLNQIQCTADCIPNCTMTWSGPNIPAGNRSVLNLQNIKRNQAGSYQCTASNDIGSMMSVTITIIVNYGPNKVIITPSTQSYTLKETDNLNQIQCTADCIPVCTITWSGPNLPADTTYVLNLQNINRNQTGNYQCTASNEVSNKISVVVNVVVQYGPIQIEISPPDNTYTVTETGSVNQITCTADCNPSCATNWTGPNLTVGSTSILNLQNIDRSQAGVYKCTAVNEISSLTLIKVNVIVNYGPRQVVIYPTAFNYTRNETLEGLGPINCTAICKPACISTWNGPNLPPGTTPVLNLANITRNQTGNYQCTASNNVSSLISATLYVVVNYQPTISNISNDKEVNENDTATITCTVESIPQSIIRWIFEANELQYKYDGSLTLNKIECLSMGRYTCQAVNMLGVDDRSVDVTVKCSPRIDRSEFDIPSTIAIKDKGILNLTADIIAFPKPEMYWQFGQNGSYLNVSKGITNSSNINRHSSNLVKSNLTEADFGTYSVYAYNGVGSTHYPLYSVDVVPARKPNQPINVTCEGRIHSVTVSWKSGFNGGKNQTFTVYYKKNDNVGNSKWIAFERTYSDPGQNVDASAEIQPLEEGASFVFQVYASNAYNYTVSETSYCNTSEAGIPKESKYQSVIIGAGAGVGSAIAILLVIGVIVFMIKRRRDGSPGQDKKLIKRRSSNKEDIPTYNEADDIDGLHANPIYVSAELRPNENTSKKMETEKTAIANEDDGHVYSQVKKKDKTGKKEKDFEMGSVYENAEDIANSRADALRVREKATMDSKQHHKYQPKRNKDGLVYADLELSLGPSGKRFVIRGLENRNNYAIIDLTKTAEPIPSDSQNENEKEKTEANDKKGNNKQE